MRLSVASVCFVQLDSSLRKKIAMEITGTSDFVTLVDEVPTTLVVMRVLGDMMGVPSRASRSRPAAP